MRAPPSRPRTRCNQLIPLGWAGKKAEFAAIRAQKVRPISAQIRTNLDKLIASKGFAELQQLVGRFTY
jgi:hypothetical protein